MRHKENPTVKAAEFSLGKAYIFNALILLDTTNKSNIPKQTASIP